MELSAVIFVPDDTAKTGFPLPTMLQKVHGYALLAWLSEALYDSGIGRFFLVCHDRYVQQAKNCLPAQAEVMTTAEANPADLLHVFLSTADDDEITIVAGPAIYAPTLPRRSDAPKASCICRASTEALMTALDDNFSFSHFLRENCTFLSDYDGCYTVDSHAALLEMAEFIHRDRMLRLIKQGVEISDTDNCDVAPSARIEPGAKLLKGAILRENCLIRSESIIGPWAVVENSEIGERTVVNASQVYGARIASDCMIGPYAHIRPDTVIERGVKVGNFVEVKNSYIGENTWASHLSYIGDTQLGARCNLGCGTVTVNFDRVNKYKTTIGDDAFIGCNSALIAPITVGNGAYIAAGSTLTDDVPEQALAISRTRQTNKKDWAAKHKK
ncbi:MAG: hypothetical protein E7434_03035 [Ruminococcaceae bacterium]|nr:hypothetical protein [Oscillospiraceae bacterium]